jgi:peptide/nickel transport system ATP-binding protein
VTSQAIMGLINRKTAKMTGRGVPRGRGAGGARPEQVRSLRGKRMAMIFQDPLSSLHPFYSIGKQLAEAVLVHQKVSKSEALRPGQGHARPGRHPEPGAPDQGLPAQPVGGMRQRVMIAMALLNDPELLIADEPTTALDVTVQAQILDLLRSLQDEFGTAIVLITHDLGVVADMADDVVVMYGGRVVERGSVQDIYYRPEMPYTGACWARSRGWTSTGAERLEPIPGQPPSLIRLPKGCVFPAAVPVPRAGTRATGATPTVRPWSRSPPSTRCVATSSRPSAVRSPRAAVRARRQRRGRGGRPGQPEQHQVVRHERAPARIDPRATTTQEDPK